MARLILALVFWAFCFSLHLNAAGPVAVPRNIYFIGNATSNVTVDLTSWSMTGLNNAAGDVVNTSMSIGNFVCRAIIFNPPAAVGGNTATVTSKTFMRQSIERPLNGIGNISFTTMDPLFSTLGGTAVPYDLGLNGTANVIQAFTFNYTSGAGLTSIGAIPAGGVDLAPGQGVVLEVPLNVSTNVTYKNGWLKNSTMYPYAKLHHICVGMISVVDKLDDKPAAVLATGSMNYLGDSYQQFPLPQGGILTRTADFFGMAINGISIGLAANSIANFYTPPVPPVPGPAAPSQTAYNYELWQRTDGTSNGWGYSQLDMFIDNGWGRSSMQPAHMQSMPIIINGGAPI